jgi:excinuclease ABC subunit B
VLDADREGFLRSDSSLVQTMGRAARNLNGKAILYADRITGSMQRAIAETDRRRARQVAFNLEHGIEPRSIQKAVADIMQSAHDDTDRPGSGLRRVAEGGSRYDPIRPEQLGRTVRELEQKMFRHAELLEFEEAARVRDEIAQLKERVLKRPEF